jgi:peptidoglycan/xylan/chitin deacetylase (PgdA/CDA1 family)
LELTPRTMTHASQPHIQKIAPLDEAIFVLSLDLELAWGSLHRNGHVKYAQYYAKAREAIAALIRLLETYRIKATWAVVGHLFLESCSRNGDDNHNHVPHPADDLRSDGRPPHDPCSNVREAPFFYAPDIIDRILASPVPHEIATHTFTHAVFGDPACTREIAYSQLAECRRLALQKGIEQVSIVFPRNSIGHLDVLCELGFTSYRGLETSWYGRLRVDTALRKACHFIDRFLAVEPPTYRELTCGRFTEDQSWLVNIPASMFYVPHHGVWKAVGVSARVKQAGKGISTAVRNQALFHLWLHPFHLATSEKLLVGLAKIFAHVRKNMDSGLMSNHTMAEIARLVRDVPGEPT